MYRGTPSPIFDIPEIPTLRRVKPLPKRRRTTGAATNLGHHEDTLSLTSPALVAQSAQALLQQSAAAAFLHQHQQQQQQQSLDILGPNATAEELLAHADTLSARMALQSYYMPILGGVQSFLAGAAAIGNGSGGAGDGNNNSNDIAANNNSNNATTAAAAALAAVASAGAGRNGQLHLPGSPGPLSDLDSLEFGVHFAAAAAAAAAAGVAMGGLGGLGMSMGMNMNVAMGMGMGMGMNAGGMGMGMERIGMGMGGNGGGGRDDDGRGDPDYVDHLQQHGNTKKRKVPANAGGSPRGGHGGDGGRPGSPSSFFPDDEHNGGRLGGGFSTPSAELHRDRERNRDRDRDRDRDREDYDSSAPLIYPPPPFPGQLSIVIQKRGKLTAATLAGLQHKEMLKSRKRQLAAVMGALSHGDTLALDQALSASYPLIGGLGGGVGGGGEPPRVHKSKRKSSRLARVMRLTRVPRHPDAAPFPACDFGFVCPSATADRLIATKEEVAMLRHQFEVELERQATKAAKMAVAAAGGGKLMKAGGGKAKREKERERAQQKASERGQQRAKISVGGGGNNGDPTAEFLDPTSVGVDGSGGGGGGGNISGGGGIGDGVGIGENGGSGGGKAKSGKKKKRSALANASNPHHLRNYVPSRLPHSGGGGGGGGGGGDGLGTQGQNAGNGNTIWPLALRFLSAEIPPRRRKKTAGVPVIQLRHPSEEWICAFCEYDLFYGEDAVYRRAVKSRKKILKRRRRARERAAAAASGSGGCTSSGKGPGPGGPGPCEYFDEYEMEGDEEEVKVKRYNNKEHG